MALGHGMRNALTYLETSWVPPEPSKRISLARIRPNTGTDLASRGHHPFHPRHD